MLVWFFIAIKVKILFLLRNVAAQYGRNLW